MSSEVEVMSSSVAIRAGRDAHKNVNMAPFNVFYLVSMKSKWCIVSEEHDSTMR